jgi:cell division protein FtsW (lipid II flippase)
MGTYTAFGLSMLIGVQTLANLGVSMGLLPTKGLNLPFVSYGGSALVISLFSVGVLLNISRHAGTTPMLHGVETTESPAGNAKTRRGQTSAMEGMA